MGIGSAGIGGPVCSTVPRDCIGATWWRSVQGEPVKRLTAGHPQGTTRKHQCGPPSSRDRQADPSVPYGDTDIRLILRTLRIPGVRLSTNLCVELGAASVGDSSKDYDTIVVGLGAAGTAASSTLARAGRRVLALEAQDRVGGRVHTVPLGDGVVELGAEWWQTKTFSVKNDSTSIKSMTMFLSLTSMFRLSIGREEDKALMIELIFYALKIRDESPATPQSEGQYVTDRVLEYVKDKHPSAIDNKEFLNEFFHLMDTVADAYEGTTSWYEVSTDSRYEELGGNQYMSWHTYGYKTLFDILLNTYNNGPGLPTLDIKLNTEVTAVSWSQDPTRGVTVTTKDGTTYTADNVIVTVSLGVLKERHESLFSPQLNQKKKTAIDKISMGLVGKIVLLYSQKWWSSNSISFIWTSDDERLLAGDEKWLYNVTNASESMGSPKALVFWTCGNTTKVSTSLTVPFPHHFYVCRTYWNTNPFTRGTYSYDNLLTPQYPTARSDLAEPLTDSSGNPRVLFAGEATNPTHYSTVHGAVETGYREAARLLPKSN
ncbi:peroxisomal N(1)-acetyl-spermine/spermidine oxidase-like [Achroia grisella]|uniref:peroxisomal N(1)-acetyl-spermine/spermidine oxidase-like n=1 Tax=Achroia grisella TaxID=688607 RepID=UPI0027D2030D|nr:peroxisomal N(1)-acetyl-spermine/spermidine oxidase-like [Achroia grisella]